MRALVIGGGIGGLATALSLHAVGIECEIFEQAQSIRELGVGINTLPHAIGALAQLDLLADLDRVGIRTAELIYTNRFGQQVWREPRGPEAGHAYPQFSIHRGKLQRVLHEAALGRVTLLGDAAHAMYPVGSNGASQAVLDARCLAALLAETKDVVEALATYERERLPATAQIVRDNRSGGPERVIDVVEARAPDGFARLEDVASHAELEAIVKGYSKNAGFEAMRR